MLREQHYFRSNVAEKAAKHLKKFPFSDLNFKRSQRQAQIQSIGSYLVSKLPRLLEKYDPWKSYTSDN
jgi:hypothetical protein